MSISELTQEQKITMKQNLLMERYDERGETPSWGELADADTLVTDEEIEAEYGAVDFVEGDF